MKSVFFRTKNPSSQGCACRIFSNIKAPRLTFKAVSCEKIGFEKISCEKSALNQNHLNHALFAAGLDLSKRRVVRTQQAIINKLNISNSAANIIAAVTPQAIALTFSGTT